MGNPHAFLPSKCGKTDRAPSLNIKKTAQNRTVEPQIYGVPEKSKTFWGEEARRRERAEDFLKRKRRRERYIVRDDVGRGRRTWSRLPARSVLLHFVQRSPPETRTPRHYPSASFLFFAHTKKQQTPQKRCLLFWQGQKDLNPRHSVLETDALPTELYPYFSAFKSA